VTSRRRSAFAARAALCGALALAAAATTPGATAATPIVVRAGGRSFAAVVENTETGRAFLDMLPLTLDMTELNGNEKYRYGVPLPTAAQRYDTIDPGDLMLYGSNCLVLFYGAAGGYSYTRVGRFLSTDGLADALGPGTATVTFEKARLVAGIKLGADGEPEVFAAESNLPEGTPVATLGVERLPADPADWRDVASLAPAERDACRFFRLQATFD
jgi:hypothetical protein